MSEGGIHLLERLAFFHATDALKHIQRANYTAGAQRFETVAEHSWHVTLLAMVPEDCAPPGTDHNRVRDLLTVHDLVEVYAGDTVIRDVDAADEVLEWELAAGERLMTLLPPARRDRIDSLWREFLAQETVEARFARAIDALHPPLVSWGLEAHGHQRAELTPSRVLARKRPLIAPFPELWSLLHDILRSAVDRGLLRPGDRAPLRPYVPLARHASLVSIQMQKG